jgi:KDO2-lipid IV(A) lauroyltransferase
MIANRKELSATALIADQAPTPVETASWMQFLGQETAVFNGPEKIAKKLNQAVVYINIKRIKRGYYEVNPTLLFEYAKDSKDFEITETFNKKLEQDVLAQPETWLWSHKRWKHKKTN